MRKRRSVWAFIRVSALTAAELRLDRAFGAAARVAMLFRLEDAYDDLGFSAEHTSGVAAVDPDGNVVAAYYAPGDPRNTSTDYRTYCIQHHIVEREVLVPIRREAANDLSADAYMPAAARHRT